MPCCLFNKHGGNTPNTPIYMLVSLTGIKTREVFVQNLPKIRITYLLAFNFQAFHENGETWRKDFPDYHSYLVWKASLNYPSNSLPSFLALRAEQHSESSSYRKGLVIPRYEPGSEASVYDRSGGATSPASERSAGRSEAGRKISAVVKTVGLSIYLTNKRKSSYKKDN